jgi:hypothetical protein
MIASEDVLHAVLENHCREFLLGYWSNCDTSGV